MFTILYHPKVQTDLRGIHPKHVQIIRKIIDSKLTKKPDVYGKPLRNTLKNLRSLRIGNYRIIYEIRNKQLIVLVLIIGNRNRVYKDAEKRK